MTVAAALDSAIRRLAQAGVNDPAQDAELLLRQVLGWDRARVLAHPAAPIGRAAESALERLVEERAKRRPIQHILGTAHFWRHEFVVSAAALVPRPETELLVEVALQSLEGVERPVVVDVGTGTGCIAVSIAAGRPDALVHATDVSAAALEVARENAQRAGGLPQITFHEGDLLGPLAADAAFVDLVVSNPPYVDASELQGLAPEVRDHEPRIALVPPDGDRYSVYRRLLPAAARALRGRGVLAVEIGLGMQAEVERLCLAAGLKLSNTRHDLQGIPRVVIAAK